jgi:MHS family proline/betaine transporter-like MFS transporter
VALGFNLSIGIVGGLTPLTATYLVEETGERLAPAMLVMIGAIIAFLAVLRFRETHNLPLEGAVVAKTAGDGIESAAGDRANAKPAYAMMSGSS